MIIRLTNTTSKSAIKRPATTRSKRRSIFLTIAEEHKAVASVNRNGASSQLAAFNTPSDKINDKRTAEIFPKRTVTSIIESAVGITIQIL